MFFVREGRRMDWVILTSSMVVKWWFLATGEKFVFHSFRKCNGRINLVISVTLGNQIFKLDELRVSLIMI